MAERTRFRMVGETVVMADSISGDVCDGADFDIYIFWQTGDLHGGSCRRNAFIKVGSIDGIDPAEHIHVRDIDGTADDILVIQACGAEDGAEIFEDLVGFLFNRAHHQVAGGWIDRDLAGNIEGLAGLDGLAVWANRGWSVRSQYGFFR